MKMKLVMLVMVLSLLMVGCRTTNEAGDRVYDPVRTEQVKAALAPLVTGGVRAVIAENPRHRVEIASYFRAVGSVFCKMQETKQFAPEYLILEIGKLAAPQIAQADPLLLSAKDAAIALYRIFYAERHRAEFTTESWPWHLADVICSSFDTALKDSGLPGVR